MVFNLNGIDLEYEIIIERRKSITLYMIDGKLIIKSYRKLNDDEINNMISRHQRFISKRLKKEELNPDIIHLLGKEYKLEIEISNYNNLIILDELNIIKIYTKKNNESYIKNIIYNY